ncbi:uncharacterized protein LOC103576651 [Microplitis demolitor]|uniref:uncharacterized protein LOC103576651 n=1 Tax=Microplitis demolitor TaxID=69319 RepID=UPI0004CD4451|nr:uncharacterized protein LOC103576651 [Microplitis demolitor]
MGQIHESASTVVREQIFPYLQEDAVKEFIHYDELVILWANTLTEKYTSLEEHAMIRQRLRMIGRFLQEVRNIKPEIKNLSTLLIPGNYPVCMHGIKKVAGMSEDGTELKAPSTATALCTLLKKICDFLIRLYIERQEHEKKNQIEVMLKLFVGGFEIINRRAVETLAKHKRLKKVVLPSQNDIEKLTTYLERKRLKAYNKLEKRFKYHNWLLLSETTLLLMQVFNRRREGEASKTTIDEYEDFTSLTDPKNKDYYNSLSREGKENANKYIRIEVRGELNRPVAIFIAPEIRESIDLILNFREAANVPEDNPYLFGLPPMNDNRHKRLCAGRLLNKYADLCGAEDLTTLRGTILRKHIATLIADNNLTTTEVSDMADFLGHHEKIHLSHYRQKDCRQIATIPQVLEAGIRKRPKNGDSIANEFDKFDEHSSSTNNESILSSSSTAESVASECFYDEHHMKSTSKKLLQSKKRTHDVLGTSEKDEPGLIIYF